MKSSALALACLSLVAASHLTACSSSDGSGAGGAGGSGESSSEAAGPGATTGPSGATTGPSGATTGATSSAGATTSSSSTGGGNECGAMATWELCDDCECTKNQAGCDAYYVIEDDDCYCGASAPCATACAASYCADLDADAACDTCMQGLDDSCFDAATTACDADPNCKAYHDASSASCDSLPDM